MVMVCSVAEGPRGKLCSPSARATARRVSEANRARRARGRRGASQGRAFTPSLPPPLGEEFSCKQVLSGEDGRASLCSWLHSAKAVSEGLRVVWVA